MTEENTEILSAFGLPIRAPGPLDIRGCGSHTCSCCHTTCETRIEECYCVEAPMGAPFPCELLKKLENEKFTNVSKGKSCQFLDHTLAYHRTGDGEAVPCCKECSNPCEFICNKAAEANKKKIENPVDADIREIYMAGLAKHLICSDKSWFKQDCHKRIVNVEISPIQIKERFCKNSCTWYYEIDFGEVVHANLFDEYIQLWDKDDNCLGNVEWFYLASKIQFMWDVVALERLDEEKTEIVEIVKEELTQEKESVAPAQQSNQKKCSFNKSIECNIQEISDKYFLKRGNYEGCVGCCSCCLKRNECEHECEYSGEKRKRQIKGSVAMSQPEECIKEEEKPEHVAEAEYREVKSDDYSPRFFLDEQKRQLEEIIAVGGLPNKMLARQKTIVAALAAMVTELENQEEIITREQPELLVLKNNNQRAAFIDNYKTWPIWIDQEETGERYYRYNLPDDTSLVVKVYMMEYTDYENSRNGEWKTVRDWRDEEYYYLLPARPFKNCKTNRSWLIEKLKRTKEERK